MHSGRIVKKKKTSGGATLIGRTLEHCNVLINMNEQCIYYN